MVGTKTATNPQSTARRQRAAPAAISSALPLLPADRATAANTPSRSTPKTVDTRTAMRCSMWASDAGVAKTRYDRAARRRVLAKLHLFAAESSGPAGRAGAHGRRAVELTQDGPDSSESGPSHIASDPT